LRRSATDARPSAILKVAQPRIFGILKSAEK
jgi:hypothetical protein